MADKTVGTATTAVDAYDRPLGNSYRKSADGMVDDGQGRGTLEMGGAGIATLVDDDEVVDEAVLEQGIHALEGKKKAWYAYLLTKDFWIVLLIGYVIPPFFQIW